jgi:hypothetical protein
VPKGVVETRGDFQDETLNEKAENPEYG